MLGPGRLMNDGTVVVDVSHFGQCAAGQAQPRGCGGNKRENGCFDSLECEIPIEGREGMDEGRALSSAVWVCSAVGRLAGAVPGSACVVLSPASHKHASDLVAAARRRSIWVKMQERCARVGREERIVIGTIDEIRSCLLCICLVAVLFTSIILIGIERVGRWRHGTRYRIRLEARIWQGWGGSAKVYPLGCPFEMN